MAASQISVSVGIKYTNNMRKYRDKMPLAFMQALNAEAETILTSAKRLTPVDTGALRASGVVQQVNPLVIRVAFGGVAASYAVVVHENMKYRHHVGQAKFLETAALMAAQGMAARVAKRAADYAAGGL